MKRKKIIMIAIIILIVIFLIISICAYKFSENGNNMISKSEEEIVDYILNIKSYRAKLEIEIETNKNKNRYVVSQSLESGNVSRQEVLEPSNIAGVITEYDGSNLKITNNNLNLSTTFENYSYIVENNLWLNSFINDYKKYSNSKVSSKGNEIVLEVKDENGSRYNIYKKLYIDKSTRKTYKNDSPRY